MRLAGAGGVGWVGTTEQMKEHIRLEGKDKQVGLSLRCCLLSYGRREGCPSPTQAHCIQLSTRLLTGTHRVQSTKLDALRVSVDAMVSALVTERTRPLTGQRATLTSHALSGLVQLGVRKPDHSWDYS